MNIYYKAKDANSILYFTAGIYLILYATPVLRGVSTRRRSVRMYAEYYQELDLDFLVPLSVKGVNDIINEYGHLL